MARKSFVLMVAGIMILSLCSVSSADVPDKINYQGKLTTASGGCLNDTVQMTFSIYSDDQGTVQDWTEDQDSVVVKDGIFNVLLGSVNPIPDTVFDGSIKYLGVQVESDDEMRPLKPMVTTGYAFRSQEADTAEYARAAPGMPDDDWVIDGDNIYREEGNVGIGTTEPDHILDVVDPRSSSTSSPALKLSSWSTHHDGDVRLRFSVRNGEGIDRVGAIIADKKPDNDGVAYLFRTDNDGSMVNAVRISKDGKVGIGTESPQGALDVNSTTGAFIVPRMTTAQRDALTAVNGMIIYNTTTNQFNFYENGTWVTK